MGGGTLSCYNAWKPWIDSLGVYFPPADPFHVTLNYLREPDLVYDDHSEAELDHKRWDIKSQNIYIGAQGVATHVQFTDEQQFWYQMASEAVPHVTLAVASGHEARNLGPMMKDLVATDDWVATQIPQVHFSTRYKAYRIQGTCTDTVVLRHERLERYHGRERTDHEMTVQSLASLPDSLWSQGPYDVGLCRTDPVTFDIDQTPVYMPQYRLGEAAQHGIYDTIEGLKKAGVIVHAQSDWNTPILPVQKPTGAYRMVHDLRAINERTNTPIIQVPNPFVALATLTPNQKWFSVLDLSNAFFCIPLDEAIRPCFAFTYMGAQYQYTRLT